MLPYILAAFLISFIIQLITIYLTNKTNLFIDKADSNKPQRFHNISTPRAGGIGIFLANLILAINPLSLKFIVSGFFAFFSGILEDFHQKISPKVRLILQLFSGIVAVILLGAVVKEIRLIEFPYPVAVAFTVFAIVGGINAINIIDGFNGLASGVSLMILTSFGIVSYLQQDYELLFIILIN
ncbi:MAG: undecaprenyl/decaprenyl-phosphate alpha-N-acetylglucosaminyl 1-phosphate transferase, partial [Aquificota bacterium]